MWALGVGLLVGLTAMAGCTSGPNFRPPDPCVPAGWAGVTPARGESSTEGDLTQWWTAFKDPTLTSLVERAVQSNLDLRVAQARIRQARASRGIAGAGVGPTVDATGSYRRSQSPGVSTSGKSQAGPTVNQYQAGFDAGWELDFFGGVHRDIEAADADLRAAVETHREVLVTLAADVARNYIDLRGFQQRIAIARRNLESQRHTVELTRQRFQGGFVGALDVANGDALVATTAAEVPMVEASARQAIYSLSVLLGQKPGALIQELAPASAIPTGAPLVPVGVPSDLIRRRPDVRRAEANIHAATARIGVAAADLFPKFSITGSAGSQSANSNTLLDPVSRFWSLGPSVSWPLFNMGRNRSAVGLQKALQEESVITYRQTVLAALQEVENALIVSEKEQEHRQALVDAVAANRKAVDLSTRLYTEGQTDFLNVLTAQRSLFASEDALVQSTGAVSTDLVALYKALGGGAPIEASSTAAH